MKTNSGKDINDKLMKSFGFYRCPRLDNPSFNNVKNSLHPISYWINDMGIRVTTLKKEKIGLPTLIRDIANNAAYQTRRRLKDGLLKVDCEINGFTPMDKN